MDNGIVWKRVNGNIIGCEMNEIEYNLNAISNNPILYKLYCEEINKEPNQKDKS